MMANIRTLGTGGILISILLMGYGGIQNGTVATKGLQRLPQEVQAFQQEDKVAIIVAMEKYHPNSGFRSLRYPEKDAEALQTELETLGYTVKLLKNEDAKRTFILQAIAQAGKLLGQHGTLIFAFTGHGFADQHQQRNYLAIDGTSNFNLTDSGLALDLVKDTLRNTGARRMMMFIDACRDNPVEGKSISNPGFINLADSEGLNILFSTGQGDISFEDENLEHGVFSYFLLEGLRGSAAQDNQLILFEDLATYVTDEVKKWTYTNKTQVQKPFRAGESSGKFLVGTLGGNMVSYADIAEEVSIKDDQLRSDEAAQSPISALVTEVPPTPFPKPVFPFEPDMEFIKGGVFQMKSHGNNEKDKKIVLGDFYMGKYEITVEEYLRCVNDNICSEPEWREKGNKYNLQTGSDQYYQKFIGAQQPIVGVSWHDANQYAQWLTNKTGKNYRLPTEAEWEYAARAGTTNTYYWGNKIGRNHANCNGCGSQWDDQQTAPVGSFAANPWRLYDMLGNVWEWTCSSNEKVEKSCLSHKNKTGPRVIRGGSWLNIPKLIRPTYRGKSNSRYQDVFIGFRLLRTP